MKGLLPIAIILGSLYALPMIAQSFPDLDLFSQSREYDAHELEGLAHFAAVLHDVNPEIFIAQIRQESRFDQHAKSPAGALGVAQIMPGTARHWKVDPANPLAALDAAARNMAAYIQTYKNQGHDEITSYKLALAAYNAGPGAVAKYGGVPPYPETRQYVSRIMGNRLSSNARP